MVAVGWAVWWSGRRDFCDFSLRGRICYHRRPIPPRGRHASLTPKGLRRWIMRRAVGAIGLAPAQAARNSERLSLHPFGSGGGAAREPCAATNTSPKARIPDRRLACASGAFPKYGCFCYNGRFLYRCDVSPAISGALARPESL